MSLPTLPFDSRWWQQIQTGEHEMQHIMVICQCTREEVLAAFHASPLSWEDFYRHVLATGHLGAPVVLPVDLQRQVDDVVLRAKRDSND